MEYLAVEDNWTLTKSSFKKDGKITLKMKLELQNEIFELNRDAKREIC